MLVRGPVHDRIRLADKGWVLSFNGGESGSREASDGRDSRPENKDIYIHITRGWLFDAPPALINWNGFT